MTNYQYQRLKNNQKKFVDLLRFNILTKEDIDAASPRNAEITELYLTSRITLREMAEIYGVSHDRIRQIVYRTMSRNQYLVTYLEKIISSINTQVGGYKNG